MFKLCCFIQQFHLRNTCTSRARNIYVRVVLSKIYACIFLYVRKNIIYHKCIWHCKKKIMLAYLCIYEWIWNIINVFGNIKIMYPFQPFQKVNINNLCASIMDKVLASCFCDVLIFIPDILPDVVVCYSFRIRIVVLRIDSFFFFFLKEIDWSKGSYWCKQCQSAYLTNSVDKL